MSKTGDYIRLGGTAIAAGYSAYKHYSNRTAPSSSTVISSGAGGAMHVSRTRRRTGRLKRRSANKVFRILQRQGDEIIYRWQQTSREYIGPGRIFIGLGSMDANQDRLPIHFMSLTNGYGDTNIAKGCNSDISLCRMIYNRTTGAFQYNGDVASATYLGADAADYRWQRETMETGIGLSDPKSVFHKYTDLKINLYGTLSVPIHYNVMLCTMKEQVDPLSFSPAYAGGSMAEGSEAANMFKDWLTNLTHNTFGKNSGKSTWRQDVHIIKQFNCTIQPLAYSDQAAEATLGASFSTAANIKELHWFITHDRYRDYRWTRDAATTLEHRDLSLPGWDQINPTPLLCDVEWGKRVYLVIQASTPRREGVDPIFMSDALSNFNGSYDLFVRNSFVYHNS
uniref:Uncharacterized protein n=1 Tax=Antarctic circular DNA molecule TaxID=2664238 RepID=A0A5Q2EZD6_9ZZZZ|nr:hypothetical protein [Antarctic circular DNA molecule]